MIFIRVTLISEKGWSGVDLTPLQFFRARASMERTGWYHFELVGSLC